MPALPTYLFEMYRDAAGEHRWRLVAKNGRIVADSGEGYKTAAGARRAAMRLMDCLMVMP